MNKENLDWYDRKRTFLGLPLSFTKYGISKDRLFVETGFLHIHEYEVRLYRIMNINLSKTFLQRIFGLGSIHIDSSDADLKCFDIKNVKRSNQVKELISNAVEEERMRNRVSSREYMQSEEDEDEHEVHQWL